LVKGDARAILPRWIAILILTHRLFLSCIPKSSTSPLSPTHLPVFRRRRFRLSWFFLFYFARGRLVYLLWDVDDDSHQLELVDNHLTDWLWSPCTLAIQLNPDEFYGSTEILSVGLSFRCGAWKFLSTPGGWKLLLYDQSF